MPAHPAISTGPDCGCRADRGPPGCPFREEGAVSGSSPDAGLASGCERATGVGPIHLALRTASRPDWPRHARQPFAANVLRHPPAGGCLLLDFAAKGCRPRRGSACGARALFLERQRSVLRGADVLGCEIKEEATATGRRRGTFVPKGIRTSPSVHEHTQSFPRSGEDRKSVV